jgi:hypothetical protein
MKGGCGKGKLRETRSTSAAPPAISRSTFPIPHRPKSLSILQRDIRVIEKVLGYKTSEPAERWTGTAKVLCTILQDASITLHAIIWEWVEPSTTITLGPFNDSGLEPQRAKKPASKLHVHSTKYAAKFVHTRHANVITTFINSQ